MKILTILFMLCAGVSFSQVGQVQEVEQPIVIGVANNEGLPVLKKYKENNQYILTYINEKYRGIDDIESLSFIANESDLERLYSTLKDQFKSSETNSFKLGNDDVLLITKGERVTVMVTHKNGLSSYFFIYYKELDNLFGRA